MTRTGINAVLLKWLKYDPDGKKFVSEFGPAFIDAAEKFLNAVSDAQRLVAAEKLAGVILGRNDLGDMAEIRREVRTLELMRKISYPSQTDHSAHTVYVYLLGAWLFTRSPSIQKAFNKRFKREDNGDSEFLFSWAFAGLLHDIGYVFSEPVNVTQSSKRLVEGFFQNASLTGFFRPSNSSHTADFPEFMSFIRKLKQEAGWQDPCYSQSDFPYLTLNALRKLPWLSRLGLKTDAFDLFQSCSSGTSVSSTDLEIYAYAVAHTGYDGHSEGETDHAVATALYMLQWVTYWYWLATETRKARQEWYDRYFCRWDQPGEGHFNYEVSNLQELVPALYSVACHNIQSTRPEGKRLLPLRVKNDPLTYLTVLCDELQKWDRFPAGERNLRNLEDFANSSLVSEDIDVQNNDTLPKLLIKNDIVKDKLRKTLTDRLHDWQSIVQLS